MQRRESATQRTYAQLKAAILEGELRPGRIDIQRLADRLRVSSTPIREALARLATERLIDFGSRGFSIARPSADMLRDLYGWSGRLVQLALADIVQPVALGPDDIGRLPWRTTSETTEARYAPKVSTLLYEVAMSQPNREIPEQLAQANNRLFRARVCEPLVLSAADDELSELVDSWRDWNLVAFRDKVRAYHTVRVVMASQICCELARQTAAAS